MYDLFENCFDFLIICSTSLKKYSDLFDFFEKKTLFDIFLILYDLCFDILDCFDLHPNQYILIDSDQQLLTYYPLLPFSLAGLSVASHSEVKPHFISSPLPLTGEVLKCEYDYIARNE